MTNRLILVLLTIYANSIYSQIDFENDFLLDSTKTNFIEYKYSPSSHKSKRFLSYIATKDTNVNALSEKYYHSYDDEFDWTITKYNSSWQILEEIELNMDSSIISREVFAYDSESRISSEVNNADGIKDSLVSYYYYNNGMQKGYKFIYVSEANNTKSIVEGEFQIDSLNNYTTKRYFEKIGESARLLDKSEHFYYTDNQLSSIITRNKKNEIISKMEFSYIDNFLEETFNSNSDGKIDERENYFYKKGKLISIIGYSKKENVIEHDNYVKIIEIK